MKEENLNVSTRESNRFTFLKKDIHLSKRVFQRISENMHYEIFKNLDCIDLLSLRGTSLGGYMLTSNNLLRTRIQNY